MGGLSLRAASAWAAVCDLGRDAASGGVYLLDLLNGIDRARPAPARLHSSDYYQMLQAASG